MFTKIKHILIANRSEIAALKSKPDTSGFYDPFKDCMLTKQEIYNQRQLKLMLNIIHLHRQNKNSAKYLISSLEALIDCLHTIDDEYRDEFVSICNDIDYDYLNLNDPNFSMERKQQLPTEINEELEELIKLIESKILWNDEND